MSRCYRRWSLGLSILGGSGIRTGWCSRAGLSERHRRSGIGLTVWLRSIVVALGGRVGTAPRVLGVDEFAFRKGWTYDTVLVDAEAGRAVDLLPDHTSETFSTWRNEHPGPEAIRRDWASAYTKVIKEAVPGVLEVADRRTGRSPIRERCSVRRGRAYRPCPRPRRRRRNSRQYSHPRSGPPRTRRDGLRWIAQERLGLNPADPPRRKRRMLFVSLAVALCVTAGSIALALAEGWVSLWFLSGPGHQAQKQADAQDPPFTVFVEPEKDYPRTWAMVFNRELTESEARHMTSILLEDDGASVFSYLRALGGHPLSDAGLLKNAPESYQPPKDYRDLTDVFHLNILSTREKAVVIDGGKVVDERCRPSGVKAVVSLPPQGEAPYNGIRLHIPPRPDEPILTDNTDGQGEPYFKTRRIEIGGGQSSGGLRVEAIAKPGQSWDWGVVLHYVDAYNHVGDIRLKDTKGKPFVLHTESAPAHPQQKWVFGPQPWTACHEKSVGMCDY